MEKAQKKELIELSEFDSSISLWQLIPAGKGKGLSLLKVVVDSILNNPAREKPSLLITGEEGKRTYGSAFLRAVGYEDIRQIPASVLCNANLVQVFTPGYEHGHLITAVDTLGPWVMGPIHQILKEGRFELYSVFREGSEIYHVYGLIVLTAKDLNRVPEPIRNAVGHVVEIEKHTQEQLALVVLQRLVYAGIHYECEQILTQIVQNGKGRLKDVIQFLKLCLLIMQADQRDVLLLKDVDRAGRLK